jgi:hypothetical protein
MNNRRSTRSLASALTGALLLTGLLSSGANAQPAGAHASTRHDSSGDRNGSTNVLVRAVREATERFRDVAVAEAEGYSLMFGCVSGPDTGAMGLHYVNLALVGDGVLDPARPEIILYEPTPDGRLKLTGADFLVFATDWHAANTATPQLLGQLLHLFESPNRFGLPPFYTLHVWAWKNSPAGTFVNWHPNVSCDGFRPTP